MKKYKTSSLLIAVSVIHCAIADPSDGAPWRKVEYKYPVTLYRGAALRTGTTATVWDMQDFDDDASPTGKYPLGYLSIKFQVQYDCRDDMKRDLYYATFSDHMGRGKLLSGGQLSGKEAQWIDTPAALESEREIACRQYPN